MLGGLASQLIKIILTEPALHLKLAIPIRQSSADLAARCQTAKAIDSLLGSLALYETLFNGNNFVELSCDSSPLSNCKSQSVVVAIALASLNKTMGP